MKKVGRGREKSKAEELLHLQLGMIYRARREAARVSLRKAAEYLECAVNTIRAHESGDTMLRTDDITKSAELFGCHAEHLTNPGLGANDEVAIITPSTKKALKAITDEPVANPD